jgi:hypothetical protein
MRIAWGDAGGRIIDGAKSLKIFFFWNVFGSWFVMEAEAVPAVGKH